MAYPVIRADTRVSEPYRSPAEAKKTGLRIHGGTDIAPKAKGTTVPVYAVGKGTVIIADHDNKGDMSGNDVMILLDGDGSRWWYGHMDSFNVRVGQRVYDGQHIGYMGNTGNSFGVHLHIERHWPKINVETDPWPYLRNEPDINGDRGDGGKANAPVVRPQHPSVPPVAPPSIILPEIPKESTLSAAEVEQIKKHIDAQAKATQEYVDTRAAQIEWRMRREVRGSLFFDGGETGHEHTFDTSPRVVVLNSGTGFILPLQSDPAARAGQLSSIRASGYKYIDQNDVPTGMPSAQFLNAIKDTMRGHGQRDATRETAAALFGV